MNTNNYKYTLIAINKQGAFIKFYGDTKSEALRNFDQEYSRSGFIITLYHDDGAYEIKKTYR